MPLDCPIGELDGSIPECLAKVQACVNTLPRRVVHNSIHAGVPQCKYSVFFVDAKGIYRYAYFFWKLVRTVSRCPSFKKLYVFILTALKLLLHSVRSCPGVDVKEGYSDQESVNRD